MQRKKNRALLPFILFVAVILLSIGGFTLANNRRRALIENPGQVASPDQVTRVTVEEAYQAVVNGEAVLLDTRSESQFQAQRAVGAINIPIDQIEARLGELDPETWYITYCTWPAENTSAGAAFIMLENGFSKANPILGGFEAWIDSGYPIEP